MNSKKNCDNNKKKMRRKRRRRCDIFAQTSFFQKAINKLITPNIPLSEKCEKDIGLILILYYIGICLFLNNLKLRSYEIKIKP